MKRIRCLLLVLAAATLGVAAAAQPAADSLAARREALAEARYLKSIFKTEAAIELLSGFVAPGIMDEELLAELADCHFIAGEYESAAGTYQLLSLHSPDNLLYRIKQMQIAFRMKDYRACVSFGQQILAQDSIPAVAALTGDAFNLVGRSDSALVYYQHALSLKPLNETVVSKAANILLADKQYDDVLSLTGDYLTFDPDNFTVLPIQGLAYYLKNEYDSSYVIFQHLEDMGVDNYPLHYYLGQCLWHTNVTYAAERELLKAWAIDSSDANLAWAIAAVKTEMYRPFEKQVKPWLDKATDMIRPDSAFVSRIHHQYGTGYYGLERFDEAIAHYQKAYRYNPSNLQALSTIAYCYERQKKYKQALEYYEKYLKVARPGTRGYDFAQKSIEYIKGELFMEE
ncbi:MAG: tetratricopeptide repeat protein [Bacteroidales bacterium]|nr:tetratricopeptide repeat protein [Bacteroidales bacterium]